MRNSLNFASLAALSALLICMSTPAQAQSVTNELNIGLPPNGVFSGSAFDNIQLNNGNLHIEIPLVVLKGRGLSKEYKYVYDNKGWQTREHCSRTGDICTIFVELAPGHQMAWKLASSPGGSLSFENGTYPCNVGGSYAVLTNYVLQESNGTKHHFVPGQLTIPGSANSNCPAYGTTLYADDGTGWIMYTDPGNGVPVKAVGPDGTVIQGGVTDTNGNQIVNGTDTLGRPLPTLTFNSTSGKWEFAYYDSSGTQRIIQITRTGVPAQSPYCWPSIPGCQGWSGNFSTISEIEFPNGMKYTFTYVPNTSGEPVSVTLPTGGQVSWTWAAAGIDDGGRRVATRTVTANGQSFQWTYSTAPNTVTLTDPLNNATRATCAGSPCSLIIKTEHFQGPATGTPLKTVTTDYSPQPSEVPIRETTTWNPQNLVTKVETDWDSFTVNSPPLETIYRRAVPLQRREYAYGTGAAGALV